MAGGPRPPTAQVAGRKRCEGTHTGRGDGGRPGQLSWDVPRPAPGWAASGGVHPVGTSYRALCGTSTFLLKSRLSTCEYSHLYRAHEISNQEKWQAVPAFKLFCSV